MIEAFEPVDTMMYYGRRRECVKRENLGMIDVERRSIAQTRWLSTIYKVCIYDNYYVVEPFTS